jgi:rSAM/selenodomain-associated transferase 2
MRICIIVPVLNEAANIRQFLSNLRTNAPDAHIIVADGESRDGTAQLARDLCDRVITSTPGRARQMNCGARVACGEVLWFLHADSEVPPNCLKQIMNALHDPRVVGGYFRMGFPRAEPVYRLSDTLAHYLGVLLRVRFGDHGIFCRRSAFEALGGYPDVPLMEDAELFRALLRLGRMSLITDRITTSARRYEQIGPYRLTSAYALIAALYVIGTPLPILSRIYRRMCIRT